MSVVLATVALLLHATLMAAAAPLVLGLVRWARARLLGRAGPPVLQPWRELLRQARRPPVLPDGASPLFTVAPVLHLAATGAAALLVPSFALGMATAPLSDLLLLAGLLGLARCLLALAAFDSGTALGGMGASRTVGVAVLAGPALLLVAFTLALLAGTTNLDAVAALLREGARGSFLSLGLALAATILVALADTGRAPVGGAAGDGTAGDGALPTAQAAMAFEHSGRQLAMVEGAAALRLLVWLTLIATVFVPAGVAPAGAGPLFWLAGALAWGLKLLVLAAGLAALEASIATMRESRVPEFLGVAVLLGLLAVVFLFMGQGFA